VLLGFTPQVVNLDATASSRLLTKGVHAGPELSAVQASDILEWMRAERDAGPSGDSASGVALETAAFAPAICTSGLPPEPTCPVNQVDLTPLGLAGAKVHFVAQAVGGGLYLNQLKVIAGTDGAYIEHPLFVSWPEGKQPVPDTIDRFFDIKLNLQASTEGSIGGGTAGFVGFVATDKLTIHFRTVQPYQTEGGGGTGSGTTSGGCKDLAAFKANAQPLFSNAVGGAAQSCRSCHAGQNTNATNAMNITGVASTTDATIQTACNQIKTRVNLTAPDQSGVYLAPDPANNNHPFRFTQAQLDAFKAGVNVWINAEKVAP
jgi:hypothetical protein